MRKREKKPSSRPQRLTTTLLLAALALASVSAVTVAWFSIADFTKLQSLALDVTAGPALRFDLDAHAQYSDYVQTLRFSQIAERIKRDKGFDMTETPLEPVTTSDCETFTFEDGRVVSSTSGAYLEFTLHFMSLRDMVVHLTSASRTQGANDGTSFSSTEEKLPDAMRLSFTIDGKTIIYEPRAPAGSSITGGIKTFGLPDAAYMTLNGDNELFTLQKETDQPVVFRIWLEGTDPACDNSLKGKDYSIQLRFVGEEIIEDENPEDMENPEDTEDTANKESAEPS